MINVSNKTEELHIQAPKDSSKQKNYIEKSRDDLDDKEVTKDSVSPSDKIEKSKEYLVARISEKNKESIKTQKVTKTTNFISQL